MSKPANDLASFRSYSYYHVLCMCDSTTTADALAESTDLGVWDHSTSFDRIGSLDDLGRYSPKCINGSGRYVVLINGSSNATYAITSAKWSTVTGAEAVPGDRGNSIAVEGSLQISEPKGVAFLDQIVKCSVALGVDASQVIYVLKTFFVGHGDDGPGFQQQQTSIISDIAPINCIVYDVTGSFTEQGGIYEMSFVSVAHGASRLPQYSSISNAINYTAGATLAETLTRLENTVNERYREYYDSVTKQIAQARGLSKEEANQLLRPVTYKIDVGTDYLDPRYTVTDQAVQFKNGSGCDAPVQISLPQSCSIETAIRTIMGMSIQVKEDMSSPDKKYEYKIHTSVVSTPVNQSSNCDEAQQFEYTVYYRIEKFMSPKSSNAFEILGKESAELQNDPEFQRLKSSVIEFDYLYTGNNTDILEFDMKVNVGMAYLQTATLTNTLKSQIERSATQQVKASTEDVQTSNSRFGGNKQVQVPVFFGTSVRPTVIQGTQNVSLSVDSAYTLSKHASIEMAEASMRITGNTQLLTACNRTTSAKEMVERFTESNDRTEPFSQWTKVPTFAKVNVRMPRNNDDMELFTGKGKTNDKNADYAQEFWFDGYFYVYGIEHVFENGEFSQTLQMVAIHKKSTFNSTQSVKQVDGSYQNKIPCAPTKPIESTAGAGRGYVHPPFERPGSDGTPTNKPDADSSAKQAELADVPGWNTASPEVKSAVTRAAEQYGISAVNLASIISRESKFNPNAKNPKSSATGLGQFIDSTWLGQVKKDRAIGVDPTAPKAVQLAARYNAQINARATASYLVDNQRAVGSTEPGDVYLAHFSGPGIAKEVVNYDKSGEGHKPLRQVYVEVLGDKRGNKAFDNVVKANPNIVRENTTVAEQRAWAAKKMGTKVQPTPSTQVAANNPVRTAAQSVGASIDCSAQEQKQGTNPCGPTAEKQG